MQKKETMYVTTPIFYPNANLHMGHAYSTTLADCLARYFRENIGKENVYLLTGADENTEKVVRAAKAKGIEPSVYLDSIVDGFKSLFSDLEISYNQFIRTSDKNVHWPGASEFWLRLVKSGDFEKRSYEGLYCVGHEAFITEKDLVDGKCPDHNEVPQHLKEENYFFKLSKYTAAIKGKIESGELEIIPQSRRNEILALLDRGLEDVSFSRPSEKVTVGIPVPDDPTQVIYVWCDALVNYVSALGFGREDDSLFNKFWPADIHVIGKDILRFHAAIWPGMLLSAGLPLPKTLLVHGFITSGGKKMSKSLGNVIDPRELINEYGAEAVRYYLMRYISPFDDGDLTLDAFKNVYNADLANGLGNLLSRVMKMATTNGITIGETVSENRTELLAEYKNAFEAFELPRSMAIVWKIAADADGLIQTEQPFKKIKTDKAAAEAVIKKLLANLLLIAEMLLPVMPVTSQKITSAVKENKMPEVSLFPRKE